MRTPLEFIADYGVSTTSYIRAIQDFNDLDDPIILTKAQYERGIADIIGGDHPPSYRNDKEARIYFLYVIQETIRAFQQQGIPEMDEVWEYAQTRARKMIEKQPWSIKDYFTEDKGEPKLDAAGNPKKRKGAKKEEAEALYRELNDGTNDRPAIIAALVDEVGLSKAGATTYFHNLKKKFGFAGPKTERKKAERKVKSAPKPPDHKAIGKKRKGPTKADQARTIYQAMKGQPKAAIIAEIVAKTKTSKAGANTYYCSCKKELGE